MNYTFIAQTKLFDGVSEEEAKDMLSCLGAREKFFPKNTTIYHMGQIVQKMGLILEGSVNIVRTDVWGNENIIGHVTSGEVFAETYACCPDQPMLVDAVTTADTSILLLDAVKAIKICASSCAHHSRLVRNLLMIMAYKNLHLSQKINHISPKSIRERLLSYLSTVAVNQGSRDISIPFNRQQLADYLSVDRSALSNELSKMRREGLLEYKKNKFTLRKR